LLLLRANYLARTEHANLVVVVFNRTLCEFIRGGAENYSFDARNVVTSHLFFERILAEAQVSYEKSPNFDEDRRRRLAAIDTAVPRQRAPIFDVILLDEAQDYLPGEISLFRRLAHNISMAADLRQQIYPGQNVREVLEGVVDRTLALRYHYRSGLPICNVADEIGRTFTSGYELISPTCNYNSPQMAPSVELFEGNLESQVAEIANRLALQRRTYPEGLLGVICPRMREVRFMAENLTALGFGDQMCVQDREDGYQPIQPDRPIWLSTVHSAKGLEFRALHFASAEFVRSFGGEQKRLAYTGVTRAKTSLVVYHDQPLPPYFDAAFNALRQGRQGAADLGVAFGPPR
jgi:DNA helicase IV